MNNPLLKKLSQNWSFILWMRFVQSLSIQRIIQNH